jgi:hypothetical protein
VDVEPPDDAEAWTQDEWIAWLHATDLPEDTGQDAPAVRITGKPAEGAAPSRAKVVRFRPTSHRVIGSCELAIGLLFIVFAYAGGFGYRPLPISPLWYQLVGWTIAYYSTFWFGWWDRPR